MKFEDNFHLVSQEATCRLDNVWEKPAAWKNCVESENLLLQRSAVTVTSLGKLSLKRTFTVLSEDFQYQEVLFREQKDVSVL